MFAAFNYSPSDYFYNHALNLYLTCGSSLYETHKNKVQECLETYISPEGIINGTALRENWFSLEETDVFISHSHKDINKVKAFAGWLKEKFNLTAFIDSCAWGYCDDLLNKIDKRYCYNKNKATYDYNLRNYTTSHVHMMLSTALTETMNRSECVIFFNTPNSIAMSEEISLLTKRENEKTTSPWIFYELTMISRLKRIAPIRERFLEHFSYEERKQLTVQYDVTNILKAIQTLSDENLILWESTISANEHPLDTLYKLTNFVAPTQMNRK